ncbi:hypothetical protein J2Y02_002635 [Neobacillus drentensis]|nr:hypothetical protein [Neobacillus drentensis]
MQITAGVIIFQQWETILKGISSFWREITNETYIQ